MKEIRLLRLSLSNFKGQRQLTMEFKGKSATLYGDNATGKTTVYDALSWLLFGKDSRGQSNFDSKPLGADGQVADHGAVTEVEAELAAGESAFVLKKTYFERWSTKRGSADERYDGNTSEYYVDGVPVKKHEFDSRVEELVDEDLFRMLTGASWFCEGLEWRRRRKTLFDMCGVLSDAEILSGAEQFAPLSAALGRLGVEDFKKKLLAERKGLSGARDSIPARLDECQKSIAALSDMDFPLLRATREDSQQNMERLKSELLRLQHGTLLDGKRNDLASLKNELSACINENNIHRTSQIIPVTDERPGLLEEIRRREQVLLRCTGLEKNELALAEDYEERVVKYRSLWAIEDARAFDAAACPACGQSLPKEALTLAMERFAEEKEQRKRDIVERADVYKETARAARGRRAEYIADSVATEQELAQLRDRLSIMAAPEQPEIADLPGFAQQIALAKGRIDVLAEELGCLEGESAAIRLEIQGKITALEQDTAALEQELAKEGLLAYNRQRTEELRCEARKAAVQMEALDKLLFLIEEFTRYKVRFVEESINSRFGLVRWRLFAEQVNGGISECCEATVAGVPYASLNNGSRINAGMDVIAALSAHYGVRVPLFVDNAESVTQLRETGGQVIRLVVSEGDKKLRCVHED